jgi:Na+/proline symporter
VAGICFLFNFVNPPEFLSVVLYLGLSGIGACIGVPLFSAIITKKSTKEGAIVSAIVGPIAYLIFNYIVGVNYWFACLLAIIVAAALMIGISAWVNRKPIAQPVVE